MLGETTGEERPRENDRKRRMAIRREKRNLAEPRVKFNRDLRRSLDPSSLLEFFLTMNIQDRVKEGEKTKCTEDRNPIYLFFSEE